MLIKPRLIVVSRKLCCQELRLTVSSPETVFFLSFFSHVVTRGIFTFDMSRSSTIVARQLVDDSLLRQRIIACTLSPFGFTRRVLLPTAASAVFPFARGPRSFPFPSNWLTRTLAQPSWCLFIVFDLALPTFCFLSALLRNAT